MFESCLEVRQLFSDYVDGQCDREASAAVRFHLRYCEACRAALDSLQAVRAELKLLPHRRVPEDLALRLRVQLSQRLHRNLLERLRVRIENAIEPLLVPASTAVLTAVICFGVLMASGSPPRANTPDVPLQLATPPRVEALAPIDFNTGDQGLTLLTHIDASGRVLDYKVLSGQPSPGLAQMMLFSLFHPATLFGKPTEGRIVLSLRRITVRG